MEIHQVDSFHLVYIFNRVHRIATSNFDRARMLKLIPSGPITSAWDLPIIQVVERE